MMSNEEQMLIGVVVIGRNEGERLSRCLKSVMAAGRPVIYVDSGSTDDSVALARSLSVDVVELTDKPALTAARARNAGFEHLMQRFPTVRFVQFVDADCEVIPNWIARAAESLDQHTDVAIVCGRRRERLPDDSIFNRLCDLEWNTPIGEATECGGDAMVRTNALASVGGFNSDLIAGEEPELCARLRLGGWKILRIDAEMTLHDAAITHFGQWWQRNVRAGHAFAEGASLQGRSATRHWVRQTNRNWGWGALVPATAIAFAWPTRGWTIAAALAVYALLTLKIFRWRLRQGTAALHSALYAIFCTLSKFPQAQGQLRFVIGRFFHRPASLIEYKRAVQTEPC